MEFDFDRVAAAWDRWFGMREAAARPVSERIIEAARIGPGSTVIDIGTGLGEPALTAARAAGAHGHVVGIDVSPAMVQLAQRRAERERVTNVEFIVSDGLSNVPPGPYDAVVSRWGMMFVADLDAVLAGALAFLRPGGGFAAATWGKPQDVPFLSLPLMQPAAAGGSFDLTSGPFALADGDDLARRMRAAGFVNVSVEPLELIYSLASPSEYFDHVSDTAPPVSARLAKLDDDQRSAFRAELQERVRERFGMRDGTVRIPNRVLIASAARPA